MKMRIKKNKINYLPRENQLKCTCCGNYYHVSWTKQQATHCASYLWYYENKWYIYGSYPSNFDDLKFIVNNLKIIQQRHSIAFNNRENTKDQYGHYDDSKLVVCDFCIKKFLTKGWITEDTTYDPYAVIDELNSFYAEDPVLYMEIMKSGPTKCMQLIREERAKSIEQRLSERKERELKYPNGFNFVILDETVWD